MFDDYNTLVMPEGQLPSPNDRKIDSQELRVPAGTIVFSSDNHIELAEDIFYDQVPAKLKERTPRFFQTDGVNSIEIGGQNILPPAFTAVLESYGKIAGGHSTHMDARMKDLDDDGVDKELAFPNSPLVLFAYPDLEVRDACFRIYNEYLAKLQEQAPGRFYGVGLINWWNPKATRETLDQLKALDIKTFLMPLNPGMGEDGEKIDFTSPKLTPVWEEIEASGVPVSHHIGEGGGSAAEINPMLVGMVQSVAPFRDMFSRYIFGGILDRHPGLQVGWFEGGINWVPSTIQDAQHIKATFGHFATTPIKHEPEYYWRNHMCSSFIVDPMGLELIDHIGADKVMWSTDYPHNESSYGFSRPSINLVVDVLGPERAVDALGGNVMRFLKL